jgi:hypothetical protein
MLAKSGTPSTNNLGKEVYSPTLPNGYKKPIKAHKPCRIIKSAYDPDNRNLHDEIL